MLHFTRLAKYEQQRHNRLCAQPPAPPHQPSFRSIGEEDGPGASFGVHSRRTAFSIRGRGQLAGGRGIGSGGGGGVGAGSGGGTGGGLSYQHMWPRDFIQDLQQNLALRCVICRVAARGKRRTARWRERERESCFFLGVLSRRLFVLQSWFTASSICQDSV